MRVESDILDGRPNDGEATGLGREHINLIGALSYIDFSDFRWHWWSEYGAA
jgi:hypothetical protein